MAHSHTRTDTIGIRDRVSGAKVGLSLVKSISAIFSHTASRVPWHSHNQFELLFVMDGATVYEFQDRDSIQLAGGHFMVVWVRFMVVWIHGDLWAGGGHPAWRLRPLD